VFEIWIFLPRNFGGLYRQVDFERVLRHGMIARLKIDFRYVMLIAQPTCPHPKRILHAFEMRSIGSRYQSNEGRNAQSREGGHECHGNRIG
jgi:hypothetical protein